MSVVLARVDDRLIHGQVVTSWVAFSGGKRKKLYRNISADDEERAAMKRLDELGCKVYARILPKDKPVDVATLL